MTLPLGGLMVPFDDTPMPIIRRSSPIDEILIRKPDTVDVALGCGCGFGFGFALGLGLGTGSALGSGGELLPRFG